MPILLVRFIILYLIESIMEERLQAECLCKEMPSYCERNGIYEGPVFVTSSGKVMTRANINKRITDLCEKTGYL